MVNVNRVIVTGNLTRDPELRALPSGASVCELRIACNTRRKNGSTGEWEDRPSYFNVVVWGAQGENAARYLVKGRPVAIDGRLEWREWEAQDGSKREAVRIVAETVQFLGGSSEAPPPELPYPRTADDGATEQGTADDERRQPAADDDDIPF